MEPKLEDTLGLCAIYSETTVNGLQKDFKIPARDPYYAKRKCKVQQEDLKPAIE